MDRHSLAHCFVFGSTSLVASSRKELHFTKGMKEVRLSKLAVEARGRKELRLSASFAVPKGSCAEGGARRGWQMTSISCI